MKWDIPSGRGAGKHELKKPICILDVALRRRNHSKSRILEKLITSSFSVSIHLPEYNKVQPPLLALQTLGAIEGNDNPLLAAVLTPEPAFTETC